MTPSQAAILTANKLMSQFSWTSFVDAETATKTRDAIADALIEARESALEEAENCAHREEPEHYSPSAARGYFLACEHIIEAIRALKGKP